MAEQHTYFVVLLMDGEHGETAEEQEYQTLEEAVTAAKTRLQDEFDCDRNEFGSWEESGEGLGLEIRADLFEFGDYATVTIDKRRVMVPLDTVKSTPNKLYIFTYTLNAPRDDHDIEDPIPASEVYDDLATANARAKAFVADEVIGEIVDYELEEDITGMSDIYSANVIYFDEVEKDVTVAVRELGMVSGDGPSSVSGSEETRSRSSSSEAGVKGPPKKKRKA